MRITLLFLLLITSQATAFFTAETGFTYINRDGFYVQGFGGASVWHKVYDATDNTAQSTTIRKRIKHNALTGGALGYFFGPFRLEGEFCYRKSFVKANSNSTTNTIINHMGRTSYMANLIYDYRAFNRLLLSAGFGAGVAETAYSIYDTSNLYFKQKDYRFAFQAIGGLALELTDRITIIGQYKLFGSLRTPAIDKNINSNPVFFKENGTPLMQSVEAGIRISL